MKTLQRTAILFLALALTSFGQEQQKLPDTPAAKQFSAWLEAFNSGDRARLLAYLKENHPSSAERIDGQMGFRDATGGFEFKKAEESSTTKLTGLVKERDSDQFARFMIEVEAAEPHKIVALNLRAIPRPADFAQPRMSESALTEGLKAKLKAEVAADRFSGAVLIGKNGKVIFCEADGFADRGKKIPNTVNTKFRIGSMNKMFTATAVLELAEAGKLSLTDTVGKILPDYPNKDVASKVTIHHLLTHTGGTGDIFGPEFEKHRLELKTLGDYVTLYGARGLVFEPGSRWEYSNYGFLLLGVIVEKVSKQTYYEFVEQNIFKPAGMTSTASLSEDQAVAERSVGYMKQGPNQSWTPNTDTLPYRGTSAGGGYSTVEDLFRFATALLNHKLLDAKHTDLLITGKVDTPRGDKYAYGFMDANEGGLRRVGHGGGAPGMNGDLVIFPATGYVVAVLSNFDPPAAERISGFIYERIPAN